MEEYKTNYRKEKERRDAAVVAEYRELMAVEGVQKMPVIESLMRKHNIHSYCTIYKILKDNNIK